MPVIVSLADSTVTGNQIINRALRLIMQIGSGESPTTSETADCLEALNAMLDGFRNDRLMCFAIRDESFSLVANQSTYTVGSGGDLPTNRILRIENAYVRASSIDYPIRVVDENEWAAIPDKSSKADWPNRLYYLPDIPTGTIYVYPVPQTATGVVHVLDRTPLLSFADATTGYYLAAGWKEMLAANLAIRVAPEYETQASQDVVRMAVESKAAIRKINMRPIKAYTELRDLVGHRHPNIITDQP